MTQLFADHGVASSGKPVKDALGRGAVFFNGVAKVMDDNMKLPECFARENALYGRFFLVKLGKKPDHPRTTLQ
jgi:tyrosyl-tRNA synthetase